MLSSGFHRRRRRRVWWTAIAALLPLWAAAGAGAEPATVPGDPGQLARRTLDIFETRCSGCHGVEVGRPRGGFGFIDDLPALAGNEMYIVPGEPDASLLWWMVEDGSMPPEGSDVGPLTDLELTTIRAWINVGAPTAQAGPSTAAESGGAAQPEPLAFRYRLVRFLGRLHPSIVHFPIALLIAAALGELLVSFGWTPLRPAVRFCVTLGAVGAIVAAWFGWFNGEFAGYTGSLADTLELHRWLGVTAAVWAGTVWLLMQVALRVDRPSFNYVFRTTLIVGAVLVAVTGHFGGVLVYGPDYLNW